MNFELTEEQNLIRDMVRSFAEAEVAPSARERDEEERFDRALMYDRLAELGLTGIVFPEEYGGAGADYISYAIAVEELSRSAAPPALPYPRIFRSAPIPSICSVPKHRSKNFWCRWQKVKKWAPSA
jgi:alkylation response protein AidB-like acyl-CoA dehydrogenase